MASKRNRSVSPVEENKRPKLIRVTDPEAQSLPKSVYPGISPFKPEFYESDSTFLIGPNLRIRMHWNDFHETNYFYLCRKNTNNSISVIRWSFFESLDLLQNIETFLDSVDSHPKASKENAKLVSYFDNKDPSRAYQHEDRNWSEYFSDADLRLEHICVRWAHRKSNNGYTMLLHSPVRPDRQVFGWIGPVFYIPLQTVRVLREYLLYSHAEAIYSQE